MTRLFISHSTQSDAFVSQLAADLRAAGFRTWVDQEDILPSQDWDASVNAALNATDAMVLVLTPHAVRSKNVKVEWSFFLDLGKPIYPVILEPCEVPFRLRLLQQVDLTRDPASGLDRLLMALRTEGGERAPAKTRASRKKAAAGEQAPIVPGSARFIDTILVLSGHRDTVRDVAFSADGGVLASASDDKNVHLYNTVRRTKIKVLIGHEAAVLALTFSPDGAILASASADRTVRLWDVARRFGITALTGHTGGVNGVAFSPDGALIASAGDDGTVRLWTPTSRAGVGVLDGHQGAVYDTVFSPDGMLLASSDLGRMVRLWDVQTQTQVVAIEIPHEARRLAFSPDGRWLVAGLSGGGMITLDAAARTKAGTVFYADYNASCVRGVAFSPDGALLAMASLDGSIRLWKTAGLAGPQKRALRVLHGHEGGLCGIAFSPDGRWLASASHDGTVRLWGVSLSRGTD